MAANRNRRIAFLGGKPLSARCLRRLFEYHARGEADIVAVVARAPGETGWWSAPGVEELRDTAAQLGLRIEEDHEALHQHDLDLILSVLYHRVLPPALLAHPRNGSLNLHCAPLPHYRGCNSGSHALLNGDGRFGATLHFMDERVDHGPIVQVAWFDIPPEAGARGLMALTEEAALTLFEEYLPAILSHELPATSQETIVRRDGVTSRYHPRSSLHSPGFKEVDLDWPADRILRHVRALDFPPFEPAYVQVGDHKVYLRICETAVPGRWEFSPCGSGSSMVVTRACGALDVPAGGTGGKSNLRDDAPDLAKIPLFDLKAQHASIREELDEAVARVVSSCGFICGPEVEGFAAEFAAYCGVANAVPCSNGTEALRLAILGVLGEGDGEDEIITVSHSFAATIEAIVAARYKPVLVDVDPDTYLMTLEQAEQARSKRTVAVIPVHLYGRMLDVERLGSWARNRGLAVIEDAAQAHGARYGGLGPGQTSDAASFSFYPGKNLGAWGDAGAVVTHDGAVARRLAQLVDHGRSDKFTHERIGGNARMDALQAAVLRVKLRHLDRWNEQRRKVAAWYGMGIGNLTPAHLCDEGHVYHQFVIQVDDRAAVRKELARTGIETGVHYPVPVHEQPAFRHLGYRPQDLPVTHELCQRVLSLPMYPEMTQSDVQRVLAALDDIQSSKDRVRTSVAAGSTPSCA